MYSEYRTFICSLSRAFPSAFCIDGRVIGSKRYEHYILKRTPSTVTANQENYWLGVFCFDRRCNEITILLMVVLINDEGLFLTLPALYIACFDKDQESSI